MVVATALQRVFRKFLQQGRIPNHVGMIVDGNRRYAKRGNLGTVEGHKKGSKLLDPVINWCILCGVKEITAYIFSIKNFERVPEEVNGILGVIRDEINRILANSEDMLNDRARYQFVGDWSYFPEDMKHMMATLMEKTKNNTKLTVNLAFAYAGRNEITSGVNALLRGLEDKKIELPNVNEALFDQSLQLWPLSPVDLMVRTGECRLSEFLSWNIDENSVLCFRDQLFPTFSYWNFLSSIFYYQTASFNSQYKVGEHEGYLQQENNDFLEVLKESTWKKISNNIKQQEYLDDNLLYNVS